MLALVSSANAQARLSQAAFETCGKSKEPVKVVEACTELLESSGLRDEWRKSIREKRGAAFVELEQYREGLIDLAYATGPYLLSVRAEAYIETEAYEDAIADLSEVIKDVSDSAEAYNARAWSYFKIGDLERALPDANRAIELNPKFAEAYDTRAHVYYAMAKNLRLLNEVDMFEAARYATSALSDYREALRLMPGLKESIEGLAEMGVIIEEKK